MAYRLRLDMDNNYTAADKSINTTSTANSTYESNPAWNRTLNAKIGWQMNKKAGKVIMYAGIDAILGMMDLHSGYASTIVQFPGFNETITFKQTETKNITTSLGGSLFFGVGTKLSKHIGLSYEASFDYTHLQLKGNMIQEYSYIRKTNGVVTSKNLSKNENPIDTYQRNTKVIPLGILMLSYRL